MLHSRVEIRRFSPRRRYPEIVPVERIRLTLAGAVQGVGFRPFVHRLATSLALCGWVRNSPSGAVLEVEGVQIVEFQRRLLTELPPAAFIASLEETRLAPTGASTFQIEPSFQNEPNSPNEPNAAVLPDLATCPDCLTEIRAPLARRHLYPFTNCTRCGPRYTIIRALPYDRPHTTLHSFPLCPACAAEYANPADRRFHAQPIACPDCGPRLSLPLETAAQALRNGQILALKGIGGYQLLADARNETAVARLRLRKRREAKPFAVMAPNLESAAEIAYISPAEARELASAAAPILLLRTRPDSPLAPSVAPGSPWTGLMLPYSPLHHLLLDLFPHPVVATSGNLAGEPIAISAGEAESRLAPVADLFLHHNRPIAHPCDDSVARLGPSGPTLLRRARGYAPLPIWIGASSSAPRILALGAHLKSAVALHLGPQIVLSPHIADLDSPEARAAFQSTIDNLLTLYRFKPETLACDLHPDYYPTLWAQSQSLPLRFIQHHHAHAAACAAENDVAEPYLAATWDGTGLGTNGQIWGGELFRVENARFERISHLRPFLLPGGDAAMTECERPAAGILHALGEPTRFTQLFNNRSHIVETTSVGRLFDALAWLSGIAPRNRYEGEAGLLLEAAALLEPDASPYELPLRDGIADWAPLVEQFRRHPSPRRFHAALAGWLLRVARAARVRTVVLSGGCFQNDLLTRLCAAALQDEGFRVALPQRVPPNDGGIALGQAVLAADSRYAPE